MPERLVWERHTAVLGDDDRRLRAEIDLAVATGGKRTVGI
jgi:hypothetical protein